MGLRKRILVGGAAVLTAVIIAGLCFGSFKLAEAFYPASKGVTYLQDHGYTDVKGGDPVFSLFCRKGDLARQYTAVDQKGQKVSETVCFGLLGTHKPFSFN